MRSRAFGILLMLVLLLAMKLILADKIEPGLSEKLINHPGHYGMGNNHVELPEIKYCFDYFTRAASRSASIAELPEIMNLSNDNLAEEYSAVKFAVDADNTITATPINHALTIPATALNQTAAKEFAALFLETDFTKYGFIKRSALIGKDILK